MNSLSWADVGELNRGLNSSIRSGRQLGIVDGGRGRGLGCRRFGVPLETEASQVFVTAFLRTEFTDDRRGHDWTDLAAVVARSDLFCGHNFPL